MTTNINPKLTFKSLDIDAIVDNRLLNDLLYDYKIQYNTKYDITYFEFTLYHTYDSKTKRNIEYLPKNSDYYNLRLEYLTKSTNACIDSHECKLYLVETKEYFNKEKQKLLKTFIFTEDSGF